LTIGEETEFASLVERHWRFVFRVVYAVLLNRADAEDAVQETFLKLYRNRGWRQVENERAFLARAAWRVAVDRRPRVTQLAASPDPPTSTRSFTRSSMRSLRISGFHWCSRQTMSSTRVRSQPSSAFLRAPSALACSVLDSCCARSSATFVPGTVRLAMYDCDNRDYLDREIDAALSTYADFEPGAGLEARLLKGLRVERAAAHRRRQMLWSGGALAAAACLVLLLAPWRSSLPHTAPRTEARVEQPAPSSSPAIESTQAATRAPSRLRAAAKQAPAQNAAPKLAVFPTPAPLTGEEQALALFAARSSAPQFKDLVAAQQVADSPIDIAAISIPPIKSPSEGKE